MRTLRRTVCFPFGNSPVSWTYLMPRRRAFLGGRIHLGFQHGTRMKGDHAAGRNRRCLSRAGIASRASSLTADRKLAKAGDNDLFPVLKGGFEEFKNPIQEISRLDFRDPGLLMNAPSNIQLSHPVSLPLPQGALAFQFGDVGMELYLKAEVSGNYAELLRLTLGKNKDGGGQGS
jgi:hypothetical protein